ncbi:WXG100 family type VII secretion target [Virgibacillus sp. 179-BFC.A HS]|uniref:ESAT-6-like protein n=1 Tax=Tigheibacillus jepli TaxID=3035914 RepID=A0ABU5CFN8_9BACI|nr:WXG100 family type VII secretion target [Virgibacillus sp. 179-BFC.A HS]MDY0404682.1 WXG100 family type VII secretion target [Virgibacillus sp. 179-BFC.A HS]
MANIRLNPEELEDYAGKYATEAERMNDVITETTTVTDNLAEIWEGEAFVAFRDQYEELKPHMLQMVELLHKVNKQLISTAQALRDADADIAGQIRA